MIASTRKLIKVGGGAQQCFASPVVAQATA